MNSADEFDTDNQLDIDSELCSKKRKFNKDQMKTSFSNADIDNGHTLSKNAVRKRSREYAHRQCRIIIRNVSYKITAKKLRTAFEQYGTLEDVNLLKRPDGKLVGCAFLQYAKPEQSDRAIKAMNGEIFMGRKLEVCYALSKGTYKKLKIEPVVKQEEIKHEDDGEIHLEDTTEIDQSENFDQEEANSDGEEKSLNVCIEDTKPLKPVNHKKYTEIEEGRTVFLKNVPYDADESTLNDIMTQFGTVEKVFINKERVSGHSKGTAFVIFKLKDSAEISKKQSFKVLVHNQFIEIVDALNKKEIRDKNSGMNEKSGKDSRNLYLLKEGLIMAGSPAAKGVSKADMAQRLRLEQRCAQMLKNLSRFVSRERLTIHNLPENYTNGDLRKKVQQHTGSNPLECRVMRENMPSFGNPTGKSRGYGFLSFKKHEIALEVLRKLNNNPAVFGKGSRPIVAFSIEDRKVHNIKQQRLLKSRLNNPTYQEKIKKIQAKNREKNLRKKEQKKVSSEQLAIVPNTTARASNKFNDRKKPKKERKRKLLETTEEFTGEISRQGKVGIRSIRKINFQAGAHMERIKSEKQEARKKRVKREHERNRQIKAARRVKPKQTNISELKREDQYFQQTVGKYKEIINQAVGKTERSKWYNE
ncbi:RNA-binding protein 28 [Topomyia yanbarensis]|uniref:RNA-binding protein 28 n=1 Tax=Topomyia yanbarensis TaxID=2498891 RepID=UPI00273BCC23|nr:RNA-binding protein 28 [Topomyia yanbarensis]